MMILRLATINDLKLLLKWRNDPLTRKASHNMKKVKDKEHFLWFINALNDPDRKIYIAEKDNLPIGMIRSDKKLCGFELTWAIAPEERGNKFGKKMVSMLVDKLSGCILYAQIKKDNIPSIKIAKWVGFKWKEEKNNIYFFEREYK